MIEDCRNGKIDLIVVKSISIMGRNTVEFLNICDELQHLGIEGYFEVENLYTSNLEAVKMLWIYT